MLQMRRAVHMFAECMATGTWPDYGIAITDISMPSYAHYQLADLHGAGRLTPPKPSAALLDQARRLQAPTQEAAQ
jgi:hypothetical protein